MIEKRFHVDLYEGKAVDAAVKMYEPYGNFELEQSSEAWIVRVVANEGIDEAYLADELANFALGTTIEARTSASAEGVA